MGVVTIPLTPARAQLSWENQVFQRKYHLLWQ